MKVFKFLMFIGICFLMFAVPGFAQDSTGIDSTGTGSNPVNDLVSFLTGFIPVKYLATIVVIITGLFLLEQYLAANTKIKANSTFQLVAGWIKSISDVLTGQK